jgi:two-component system, NarL family, sensor kinase
MMINYCSGTRLSVAIFCSLILLLELMAPVEYIFGYLYIIPMLLIACDLTSCATPTPKIVAATSRVTAIGIFLTLSDFVVLQIVNRGTFNVNDLPLPVTINRISIVFLLLLTNWLIKSSLEHLERIYRQKQEISRYQVELSVRIQLDRMHEDFVYTLTHDLKTPLIGAIQTIKYFQREKFGSIGSTQKQVLAKMYRSQCRSLELVETLLDVYHNDSEGILLHSESIDLRKIAQESIDTVLILGLERRITLNLKCNISDIQQPKLIGDRLQLSRVFINLLSNAIYHAPHSSNIDIKIECRDLYYQVKVIDRGQGISSVDLPWIFDRFYQARDGLKGSGLGLYLSRQIVEAHGGQIWAESVLPHGSKLCFRLPVKV